jgi:long-chain fatty acid transport protein
VGAPLAALAAGVNAGALFDSRITSEVEIPAVFNLSYFTRLNERWDLMADAQWTQWSTIRHLTFLRADGSVLQSTPENFRNTWKLAIGANYRYSPQWTLRGGIAVDKSPVQRAFLTPRLPDGDRTWVTLGARYTVNPQLSLDFGAAYIFVKKTNIDHSGGTPSVAANGLINGYYDSRSVVLSAQLNYVF